MFPEPPPSYDMAMAALSSQHGSEGGTVSSLSQELSAAIQGQTSVTAGESLPGGSDAAATAANTIATPTTTTTVLVNTASHSAC